MSKRRPDLRPSDLDRVQAWGWPWHQVVKQPLGATEGYLTLADTTTVPVQSVSGYESTLLWDIGATAPETSAAIAALGGEWWGKAVVRIKSAQDCRYGGGLALNSLPLWIPPVDETPPVPFFAFAQVDPDFERNHFLRWSYLEDGAWPAVVTPLSLADIGQPEGSPDCLVFSGNTSTMGSPSEYSTVVLDTWRNKVLLGILGVNRTGLVVNRPGGTSPPGSDGLAPSNWSRQYLGLAEVVATSKTVATWTLLEDRATALGNPEIEELDAGTADNRTYSNEMNITGALLNAWYRPDGTVQTSRYHRHDLSTYRYAPDPLASDVMVLASQITTTITLLDLAGSEADALELTKRVDRRTGPGLFDYTSTITRGEEEPSVAHYADTVSTAPVEDPFVPTRPGDTQMLLNMLGQQVNIGGVQVLPTQGYRQCWIARGSNKAASICFSFEDSPYDEGEASTLLIDSGPCVTPTGVDTARTAITVTNPAPALPELRRYGFFVPPAYLFTLASFNPVTGALARNDHENYSTWA